MVYNRFFTNIVFRIVLAFATGYAFLYLVNEPNLLYVKMFLCLLTLVQIILLLQYINKINRKLSLFFESVKTDDYNVIFSENRNSGEFNELNFQLDQLSKHIKDVVLKREEKDEYFKAVIEHVGIGIFAFDSRGSIRFINTEALKIFGLTRLKNIFVLDYLHHNLSKFLKQLSPGQQQLLELNRATETLQLAARVTKYKIAGEELNLVSLQNIKPELDLKETETWQKMIRILTHEIMNSVSPITSLANSLSDLVKKDALDNEKMKSKLNKGLATIKNRGEGMMDFVRKYRNLAILPLPQITEISVKELMNELTVLFEEIFEQAKIEFNCTIDPDNLILNADREQIEQVLINLIKNAVWALNESEEKTISVKAFLTSINKVQIEVRDTGVGFDEALLGKIFIPFFTTRDEGSGIGLSLARQIMIMLGGSISAHSNDGRGALFVLTF